MATMGMMDHDYDDKYDKRGGGGGKEKQDKQGERREE